jgi:hypothetical protein
MPVGVYVRLHRNALADDAFDRKPAAVNFRLNIFDHGASEQRQGHFCG